MGSRAHCCSCVRLECRSLRGSGGLGSLLCSRHEYFPTPPVRAHTAGLQASPDGLAPSVMPMTPSPRHSVHCPALLVGAPASGQGKTTATAALARWHRQQGLRVRVFKTGPDFLDPMVLERASGQPVWLILGENEGHGFTKKDNNDYLFFATIAFIRSVTERDTTQ